MRESQNPYRAPKSAPHAAEVTPSRWAVNPWVAVVAGAVGATLAGLESGDGWHWIVPLVFIVCGVPIMLLAKALRR
jgi:hypothetical protein